MVATSLSHAEKICMTRSLNIPICAITYGLPRVRARPRRRKHNNEIQSAWAKRYSMTSQGLSMLGLALHGTGDLNRAKEIAKAIESAAVVTDREASWPATYDYFMELALDDGAETTAYAVRLLSLISPESPLLPKA